MPRGRPRKLKEVVSSQSAVGSEKTARLHTPEVMAKAAERRALALADPQRKAKISLRRMEKFLAGLDPAGIEAAIEEHRREIARLERLRALVGPATDGNGHANAAALGARCAVADEEIERRIAELLGRSARPLSTLEIATALSAKIGAVRMVLEQSVLFDETPDGKWRPIGDQARGPFGDPKQTDDD